MKSILIVDDDAHIGNMLEEMLRRENYLVYRAYSGTEALLLLSASKPDLILLDLMLPGLNGEEVLPQISGIPVIILSAKADIDSKVRLLLSGAVDYITKPFDTKELLARVAVGLRNAPQISGGILRFGALRLDIGRRVAQIDDNAIKLTRTEFAILKLLMQNPHQVTTKSILLDRISEDTPDCTDSSLKMHISNLRKKTAGSGRRGLYRGGMEHRV